MVCFNRAVPVALLPARCRREHTDGARCAWARRSGRAQEVPRKHGERWQTSDHLGSTIHPLLGFTIGEFWHCMPEKGRWLKVTVMFEAECH